MSETFKMLLALGLPFAATLLLLYFTLRSGERKERKRDVVGPAITAAMLAESAQDADQNKRKNS